MTDPHLALLDAAMHAEAVADRARRRLIVEADDQDATFVGSLRAYAESGAHVVLDTTTARSVRGRIEVVGDIQVRVRGDASTSYVRIEHVTAVRGTPAAPLRRASVVDDPLAMSATVGDELRALASGRSPVDVLLVGGGAVSGELTRVGADVVTVRSSVAGEDRLVHLRNAVAITVHDGSGAPR